MNEAHRNECPIDRHREQAENATLQAAWRIADEAVLRDRAANSRPTEQEPFGYFKAEPFGWTDCSPTDEGAIPLYERPAAPAGSVAPHLLKLYGVSTDAELIAAQARHIERLQAKLPRNPSLAPQRAREG